MYRTWQAVLNLKINVFSYLLSLSQHLLKLVTDRIRISRKHSRSSAFFVLGASYSTLCSMSHQEQDNKKP